MSEPRKSSKGRIASVVDGSLWPTQDPLAMLVTGWPGPRLTGWRAGAPNVEIAPVDVKERPIHPGSDFISPGGMSIVTELWSRPSPDLPREHRALTFQGIFRTDLSTGEARRVNYALKAGFARPDIQFGESPDGTSIAVLQGWREGAEPPPVTEGLSAEALAAARQKYATHLRRTTRITLTVATVGDSPSHEVLTFAAQPNERFDGYSRPLDAVHSFIQWSPDGSRLAAWMPVAIENHRVEAVRIFDTTSWTEVAQFPSAYLAGTASWGPDSDRLLFERYRSDTNEREVWIQHLDGGRENVTAIPKPNREGISKVRPLGLADNNRLVTVRTTKTKATIALTSATTGEHQDVLTWPEHIDARPVIAQLPVEAWE